MVKVEFLGPIKKEPIEVDTKNLNELSEILKQDSSLIKWLENSAIAINDTLVNKIDHPLNSGDKVSLLPPVCGG